MKFYKKNGHGNLFECNILYLTKEQYTTFTQRVKKQTTMSRNQYTLTSENISSNGGFSLVSRLLASNRSFSRWDNVRQGGPQQCHSNQSVVRCLTLMMCAGCSNYYDVEKFRNDCLFKSAVGAPIPSESTLRQRLESMSS